MIMTIFLFAVKKIQLSELKLILGPKQGKACRTDAFFGKKISKYSNVFRFGIGVVVRVLKIIYNDKLGYFYKVLFSRTVGR